MTAAVLVRGMQPCPHCGVLLDGSLVAAIRNPARSESCPKRPKPRRAADPGHEVAAARIATIAALMMLGAPQWITDAFERNPYGKVPTPFADRLRDEQIRSLEERLGIEEEAA